MPTFTYSCDCGKQKDVFYDSHTERTETVDCDCGGEASYDFLATVKDTREFGENGFAGHISEALGVRPEDVQTTIEEDRKMGSMAADYLPDGRLKFNSKKQLKMYMRERGFFDRNSYYD